MTKIRTIEGDLNAKGLKFAIIAGRFNDFVVDRLLAGAGDYLTRHGGNPENFTIIRVPGAFELPLVAKKAAASGQYNGIICLGAVIRGATPHFDYVASEASTDNLEQAIERAGSKGGNKGVEAAAAVLETVRVLEQL